jgi:hypothetical protein
MEYEWNIWISNNLGDNKVDVVSTAMAKEVVSSSRENE